jgi:hypothetical protein
MLVGPDSLIADFVKVAPISGLAVCEADIGHQSVLAPHEPPKLPHGKCAVYVFSLSHDKSTRVMSQGIVLKVGKAGPNTRARFEHQHYGVRRAPSTLSKSLLKATDKWPSLGINALTDENVGGWLRSMTDRDHFFLDCRHEPILDHLEIFLRGKLHPMFEGRA